MKKLLLLTFILIDFSMYAQIQIKGIVIDGLTSETLIGANVIVKGTNMALQPTLMENIQLFIKELSLQL